jgi:hypothetical protein
MALNHILGDIEGLRKLSGETGRSMPLTTVKIALFKLVTIKTHTFLAPHNQVDNRRYS